MKIKKFIGHVLFAATIISLFVFFIIACMVGDVDTFGTAAMILYSWIIYFAAVVGIASVVYALLIKKDGYRYKKNLIASIIIIPLSLIFGSFRFFYADTIDCSDKIVVSVNEKTGLSLPRDGKIVTLMHGSYSIANEKVVSGKDDFEASMDDKWKDTLSTSIKQVLPLEAYSQATFFDHFMFYDCESSSFNEVTVQEDGRSCVFLAYSTSSGRLMILDEYKYVA